MNKRYKRNGKMDSFYIPIKRLINIFYLILCNQNKYVNVVFKNYHFTISTSDYKVRYSFPSPTFKYPLQIIIQFHAN